MNDDQVRSKVMSVCKKIRTFVKSKKSKELAEFLTMPFVTRSNPVPSTTNPRDAISAESRAYKDLKKVNEKLEVTVGKQKMNISVLTEECESLRQKKKSLNQVKVQFKDTVKENRSLKSQLKEKEEKLENVTQTRTYKHNTLLRKKLQEASHNLESLNTRNEELGEEVCAAKHKLSLAQTAKSNFKKKFEKEKERCKALTEEFQAQDEPDNSLKCESKNKFKFPLRLAYMELQGKAEVAASKCSKVVQIVGKHIFGHNFSMEELPSSSSALNFAYEAHHISLHQVVDEINHSDHYTFASDGTSRQKTQFLERHIILSDKTQLSIGLTEIASDDTKTLLEQTVELLQEITEIFCIGDESKKDTVFRELITKMKCLLSDRAAVNKLFNNKIAEYRREYLGDETATTHFLYCNAHFLLGLARATEDAVQEMEKELSQESNLGRDARKFVLFASSTESVAFRLVRLAADCFGPRCDEKSGSRAEWLAYLPNRKLKM